MEPVDVHHSDPVRTRAMTRNRSAANAADESSGLGAAAPRDPAPPRAQPARARAQARALAELDLADRDGQDAALRAHAVRVRVGVRRHRGRGALRPGAAVAGRTRPPVSESSPAAAGPGLAVQRAEGRPAITLNSGVTLGAADVLGGRGRRVHRGDLRARRRVRPRRRARAPQRSRVRIHPQRDAARRRRLRRVRPRARRLDHLPVVDAPPAQQRGQRDGASHLGRPRPARRGRSDASSDMHARRRPSAEGLRHRHVAVRQNARRESA